MLEEARGDWELAQRYYEAPSAGQFNEKYEAACQRVFEVRETDAAHRRTCADRIRPHENV